MATLLQIREKIKKKLDDPDYTDPEIDGMINDALQAVAGGVLMPDGDISPPLPDLYASDTVTTVLSTPYASLPADYQRNVFYVSDSTDYRVYPVRGGDYYSFTLFVNSALKKDLSSTGSVMSVCVKGNKLYYQGIPSAATDLTVQYYRKPATLTSDSDEPEGIPAHLALNILKHYVLKEEFGENIEDGEDNRGSGAAYHEKKFYEFMETLRRFVGEDAEPVYYSSGTSSSVGSDW